jgi:phage terminase large subunit-like protein
LAFPEPRGVGILLASTREQARHVADSMVATIMADEWLQTQFHVRSYKHEVEHIETGTIIKTVAAELSATVGVQPSFFVCDELHMLGQKEKGAKLVRQLMSGSAVRKNPLGILISTAPLGPGAGIYQSIYNRAHRILAGEGDGDRMFPVCYELPPDVDPNNPKWWAHANPSLGRTFTLEWLKREHQQAINDPDPSALEHFYSQHLNLAAAQNLGVDRMVPLRVWDSCADPGITLASLVQRCPKKIWAGVDAGGLDDLTSAAVVGETETGDVLVWAHSWVHSSGYEYRRQSTPLAEFKHAGDLTVFDEVNSDLEAVAETIESIKDHVQAIGVDPHGLRAMTRRLEEQGLQVLGVPQGWKLSPHIHQAVRDIHSGKVRQYAGGLTRWCISNARVQENGQAISLVKPSGASVGSSKIDAAIAVVLALAARSEVPAETREKHQLFFI